MFRSLLVLAALIGTLNNSAAQSYSVESLIRVNQFGYLPDGTKVAVIADPQVGFNAGESFTPGTTYQVRRSEDDSVVFEGTPVVWKNGNTHLQSGDRGWWFDFSAVTEAGEYYLWDVEKEVGSHGFEISETVFNRVLDAAIRVFYYQRLAFEKKAEFAGEAWADGPAFIHPGQDTEVRSVLDRDNPETERDLRGGWMDAGDTNKYVTFAAGPVHQLLSAYEENPGVFRDDLNIPESGNGIPDILDEVQFEMQWMARMQEADGGVILKMGAITHNTVTPPSADHERRYYVPACSSSTIAAAGVYAHAAIVLGRYEIWVPFAAELGARARRAWDWYFANPRNDSCDDGTVKAGDADRSLNEQDELAVVAAIYLHLLTGEEAFGNYVSSHWGGVDPFSSGYYFAYNDYAADAFLQYIGSSRAPRFLVNAIRDRVTGIGNATDDITYWDDDNDLYRAHMKDSTHHWGSNSMRSKFGNANLAYKTYGINGVDLNVRKKRATGFLDYLCGVNPMGFVYLTNMGAYGAETPIMQIYHSWFADGSAYDDIPAPGYVSGGPNKNYTGDRAGLVDNPPQKVYLDFNDLWPTNSWEITEPAIYYQSAFVKMVSKFARKPPFDLDAGDPDHDGIVNSLEAYLHLDPNKPDNLMDQVALATDQESVSFSFRRSVAATPGPFSVEWSTDLAQWNPVGIEDRYTLEVSGETVVEEISVPITRRRTVFLRFAPDGS